MSTHTSPASTYSRHVGRIGALAAALGIGLFVATSPGVASAETTGTDSGDGSSNTGTTSAGTTSSGTDTASTTSATGSSSTTGPSSTTESTGTDSTAATSTQSAGTATSSVQVAPGVTISANSIKIGKHTVTVELPAPTAPAAVETPQANSVEPASGESSEAVDPAEGSVASVQTQAPTLFKAESKSTKSGTLAAVTPSVSLDASKFAPVQSAAADVVKTVKDLQATIAGQAASAPEVQAFTGNTTSSALTAPVAAAATALVAPATQVAAPVNGVVGFFNQVVTTLLNPFLAPAPTTPEPVTPVVWAVLGWVRRNLFNQAPTVTYNPVTTVQTGQTVTGKIGATDAEGDALTYTVTDATPVAGSPSTWTTAKGGTVTIDQATGNFTYTPKDINYNAVQTDSFTVTVADGKTNLLSLLGVPHSAQQTIDLAVKPPTVVRHIVPLPAGFTDAAIPRFAADGKSLLFSATPPGSAAGARREIYQVNEDGTALHCITCGLTDPTPRPADSTTPNTLFKPVPFEDSTGRILMQSVITSGTAQGRPRAGSYTNVIYDPRTNELYPVITPPGNTTVDTTHPSAPGALPSLVVTTSDPQREMRVSPDGTHVLFSQIQIVGTTRDPVGTGGCPGGVACGFSTAVPVVGTLTYDPVAKVYNITDARVVAPVGEGKQWTHDGKGVIVQGGLYDGGNVDDIVVDLATGNATRLTGNLDYDEDADLSPNNQWLAIDTGRQADMLLPASRIQRPAFLPLLIQGSVYTTYAGSTNVQNVTNQPVLIAVADDLNREDGIPLYVNNDGWTARSMPSWSADGTQVAFWEADKSDPTGNTSRLVVADVLYTTSAATPLTPAQQKTPALSSSIPTLVSNVPQQVTLPEAGTVAAPKIYNGTGGSGTAAVSEETTATGHIIRTVNYVNYVNEDGMILNGYETTDQSAAQNNIHYAADIEVTGARTGYLRGDVNINKITRTIVPVTAPLNASSGTGTSTDPGSMIRSQLDGETQPLVLNDPLRVAASRAAV
jgi:hypothetical protein